LAVDITLLYASSLLGEFKIEEYLGKKWTIWSNYSLNNKKSM
jgi:hypothetical protein